MVAVGLSLTIPGDFVMRSMRRVSLMAMAVAGISFSTVEAQDSDIVDVAVGAGSFNTLVAALEAADLVETLRGEGPFTVFAPTDEAFAALPDGTVETLLDPANKDQLTSILLYHVVAGRVESSTVVTLERATTVQGSEVVIGVSDAGVTVNSANVTAVDIGATNGVIHVLDAVLLPPAPTAVEGGSWGEVKLQAK
jgi:uncharacterized surface protein with fasciclin (FAS1) repeats